MNTIYKIGIIRLISTLICLSKRMYIEECCLIRWNFLFPKLDGYETTIAFNKIIQRYYTSSLHIIIACFLHFSVSTCSICSIILLFLHYTIFFFTFHICNYNIMDLSDTGIKPIMDLSAIFLEKNTNSMPIFLFRSFVFYRLENDFWHSSSWNF